VQGCEGAFLTGLRVDQQRLFAELDVSLAGEALQTWIAFNEAGQPVGFSVDRLDLNASSTTADHRFCLGEIDSIKEIEGGFRFEGDFGCFSITASTFERVSSKADAVR
jgi:hypothetical protein